MMADENVNEDVPASAPDSGNDKEHVEEPEGTTANGEEGDQFEALLSDYLDTMPALSNGQLVKATVIAVNKESVLLDVGDKAEAMVDAREFQDFRGKSTVKVGDEIEVMIQGRDNETGNLRASYRNAQRQANWDRIVEAHEKGHTLIGVVNKVMENGVMVDVGIPCFMHASQVDLTRVEDLKTMLGQEVTVHVLAVNRPRHRATLSRRKVLAEEQAVKRSEVMATLEVGSTINGKVKKGGIVEFGVFIDLGGVDGLVPRDEVAWERHVKPAEVLRENTHYNFKVIAIDTERGRITLSRKQIKPDPWTKVPTEYPVDSIVTGKVINITNNCAYVQLADGIEGRIQRDDLSWSLTVKKPSDVMKKGEEVSAKVLGYEDSRRLLNLGLKQTSADPWDDIETRYPQGSRQTVKVIEVVPYGAFVKLDEENKGLIHVSDMSHDRNFKNPKKLFNVGDEIEAMVLKLDRAARRINMGIKQLTEDPWQAYVKAHPKGSVVTGKAKSVTGFGVFVELAPKIEGLLHISQWSREKVDALENVVKTGDELTVKIIKVEPEIQKISLSRKDYMREEERRTVDQYRGTKVQSATTNLGSLISGLKIDVKK